VRFARGRRGGGAALGFPHRLQLHERVSRRIDGPPRAARVDPENSVVLLCQPDNLRGDDLCPRPGRAEFHAHTLWQMSTDAFSSSRRGQRPAMEGLRYERDSLPLPRRSFREDAHDVWAMHGIYAAGARSTSATACRDRRKGREIYLKIAHQPRRRRSRTRRCIC
jgi:hypothetical protein